MSDLTNPHSDYGVSPTLEKPRVNRRVLTDTMLAHLNGAAPWLRFMGVLGIIHSGIIIIGGLLFFFPVMEGVWDGMLGFGFSEVIFAIGIWWGVFYVAAGLVVLIPSLLAFRFGGKIRSYSRTGEDRDLEIAFKNNKSMWKFCGILCIIGIALGILATVLGILAVMALGLEGFL
ncbi:MAG: DUF5362 family protein [Treponema sp.]|nr:DUF5362 family protein [Treponema sp.]